MLNMKTLSIPTALAASITLGTLLVSGSEPAHAVSLKKVGEFDLKKGDFIPGDPSVSHLRHFVQTPVDDNQDGYYETVLKLTVSPKYIGAYFEIEYDDDPSGISTHIGDSATNNGHKGDYGTQSNDAEIHIGVAPTEPVTQENDLFVYPKDGYPNNPEWTPIESNVVSQGQAITLGVYNDHVTWNIPPSADYPLPNNVNSEKSGYVSGNGSLFALNGQPDTEGPVNRDIYVAFNRSIDGLYRPGSGVSYAKIYLATPEPLTILGSVTALGFGGLLKREYSKKQKKSKQKN